MSKGEKAPNPHAQELGRCTTLKKHLRNGRILWADHLSAVQVAELERSGFTQIQLLKPWFLPLEIKGGAFVRMP